jgi:hypothetical protein
MKQKLRQRILERDKYTKKCGVSDVQLHILSTIPYTYPDIELFDDIITVCT